MAKVVLTDAMAAHAEGVRELDTRAEVYRDLLRELTDRWPALAPDLERTAVAIDGQIYQDAFLEPIEPHSEVFFMARIEGG